MRTKLVTHVSCALGLPPYGIALTEACHFARLPSQRKSICPWLLQYAVHRAAAGVVFGTTGVYAHASWVLEATSPFLGRYHKVCINQTTIS